MEQSFALRILKELTPIVYKLWLNQTKAIFQTLVKRVEIAYTSQLRSMTFITCKVIPYHLTCANECALCIISQVASEELIRAAACGDVVKVTAILKAGAARVDVVDRNGHSALFAAAVSTAYTYALSYSYSILTGQKLIAQTHQKSFQNSFQQI